MVIAIGTIELDIPGVGSLKEKRGRIKSLKSRLHKTFNVSVAEVDLHEVWQSSSLGIAVVSNSAVHAEQVIENAVRWIENNRPDLYVVIHETEIIHV
jgi:hypothetical protein